MSTTQQHIAPLAAGDTLTWEEFERRWDASSDIKFAELIGGKVYMPPPLSMPHSDMDSDVHHWLSHYALHTKGCRANINPTLRILKDAPQPDTLLRIEEKYGGRSRIRGKYLHGAPELIAEICVSSAAFDLHEKKELYERAGVDEFIVVLVHEKEVRWHRLDGGHYLLLTPDANGIIRSTVFPGLWLNPAALVGGDIVAVIDTVDNGIASPEHDKFVELIASRYRPEEPTE